MLVLQMGWEYSLGIEHGIPSQPWVFFIPALTFLLPAGPGAALRHPILSQRAAGSPGDH